MKADTIVQCIQESRGRGPLMAVATAQFLVMLLVRDIGRCLLLQRRKSRTQQMHIDECFHRLFVICNKVLLIQQCHGYCRAHGLAQPETPGESQEDVAKRRLSLEVELETSSVFRD